MGDGSGLGPIGSSKIIKIYILISDFILRTIFYEKLILQRATRQQQFSNRTDGKKPLKQDVLLSRKLGILNVVDAMELPPEIVYPIYMAASSDCQELVVKRGEDLLKKKASNTNLDDPDLIKRLLSLFIDTTISLSLVFLLLLVVQWPLEEHEMRFRAMNDIVNPPMALPNP
uniref:Proteasome component Ecm29 N-terminal domain-containing protein n=1 Tax=Kalanchoe fedtschenkoi TaxID=63787 RepID=A0A7N0V941_KALFE